MEKLQVITNMVQTEILKLLEKEGPLLGTDIIIKLRKNGETKEFARKTLRQMVKYHDISCVTINFKNSKQVADKYVYFKKKMEGGYKVRRKAHLYML